MAQLHERAVLKCGTGNDLAPSAQLQHVLIVDDLQDDFFDSGHHLFIPNVPAGGADIVRKLSFVKAYFGKLPLPLRQFRPLSERVPWRELRRTYRKPRCVPTRLSRRAGVVGLS